MGREQQQQQQKQLSPLSIIGKCLCIQVLLTSTCTCVVFSFSLFNILKKKCLSFFVKVVLFRSLSPGKFHADSKVIFPPLVKVGDKDWYQPGTGFGYAVCGVDLNNDG